MKFSLKDFFSKCDQICSFLRIWSHVPKKSLMENFIFCVVKLFDECTHHVPKTSTKLELLSLCQAYIVVFCNLLLFRLLSRLVKINYVKSYDLTLEDQQTVSQPEDCTGKKQSKLDIFGSTLNKPET